MFRTIGIAILLSALLLVGCADPAADKPTAVTKEPEAKNTETARQSKGESVPVTPEDSKVEFTGSKVTGKHDGGFKTFTGNIDLVEENVLESQVIVDIDMKSVFSDADGLTEHLKTGDFFEIEKHPKSSFVSTKIVADEEKGADNYKVTGDLEMRGKKKSIEFPAKITVSDTEVGVDAEFAINRKDFGIVYAGKADDLIRDNVVIRLNLKSKRKK